MNLWNDTFTIIIDLKPYGKISVYYKGSLKGAIRKFLESFEGKRAVASFYNSKGEWIKEIGL